jgi:hypothetical protein
MAVEAGKYADVYHSWQQHLFNFNLAVRKTQTPGLRKPQLAASYAALGHLVKSAARRRPDHQTLTEGVSAGIRWWMRTY